MAVSTPICNFGWAPPAFELTDTSGAVWTLESLRGPKGLLLMFICNHCPYVKSILGRLCEDLVAIQALGVGVAAIMSNDPRDYPEDSPENMQRIAREMNFSFPYLLDATQSVARAYDAVCTPDFFAFNSNLALQYRGRFDSTGMSTAQPGARHELLEAMQQIAATGKGPAEQIPSIGCSIKWAS